MLSLFRNFVAIPTPLSAADGYHIHADKIAEELARGTSVMYVKNGTMQRTLDTDAWSD
jgi:hypothetical protein